MEKRKERKKSVKIPTSPHDLSLKCGFRRWTSAINQSIIQSITKLYLTTGNPSAVYKKGSNYDYTTITMNYTILRSYLP